MSLGLYVHVPFCRKKCAYCDFYSVCDLSLRGAYVDALVRELSAIEGFPSIDTIFVGGGTPSLLTIEQWLSLLGAIYTHFHLESNTEFTVECNPESVDEALLSHLSCLGVNRISIGVQSLDEAVLQVAGRVHTGAMALDALRLASRYFDNVNADIIVGFPGDTPERVCAGLARVIPYVHHISVYALQLEEGTPLYRSVLSGAVSIPDEDTTADLYQAAAEYLASKGFERYEVSNFALHGYACRHNLNCWRYHPYVGVGAAAHGFEHGRRYYHPADLRAYIADPLVRVAEDEATLEERKFEMIMLGLRTTEGLDIARFNSLFGADFVNEYRDVLAEPLLKRMCILTPQRLSVTPENLYISNQITLRFMR